MPDFDTRKPQEPNEPRRHRIALIAGKLRTLLIATRPRILLIANRLRSLSLPSKLRGVFVANRLRSVLIGGVLLFVMATVPVGLLTYTSGGIGDHQQKASGGMSDRQQVAEDGDGQRQARCTGEGGSQQVARSNKRPEMVFTLNSDIWTMNADGSGPARVTDNQLREDTPVWSPDGKKIAYVRYLEEFEEDDSSASASPGPTQVPYIYVMNADGSDQRKVLDRSAMGPSWSPNGKCIAFWDYGADETADIYVMNANGSGDPRLLTTYFSGGFPAWSPDGEKVAFESSELRVGRRLNNYMDIYVMNADGSDMPQRLTDTPGWNRFAEWSPDSTEIAYTYMDFGSAPLYGQGTIVNTDVYKMDADSSRETRLTHTYSSKHPEADTAWSPSGSHVAVVNGYISGTQSGSTSAIYVVKSDGSGRTLVRRFRTLSLKS